MSAARKNGIRFSCLERKFMLFAVFFVLLTIIQTSNEFAFFRSEEQDAVAAVEAAKRAAKKHVLQKKFKFRKLERVYDDEGDDGGVSNGNDNDDDGDDNDASNDNDDNDNDNDEFLSERKSAKKNSKLSSSSAKKISILESRKSNRHDDDNDDEDDDEDADDDGERDKKGSSFFSWFGFGGSDSEKEDKSNENEKSSSLIDSIKWLGEKLNRFRSNAESDDDDNDSGSKGDKADENTSSESWITYLNRWPFNSIFPFEKSPKSRHLPKHKRTAKAEASAKKVEPISEEHFESLLYTLPSFTANPSKVPDVDCRQQLQVFQRQLRSNKLWALQMLDASGKVSSGVLRGNINQFGDFEMCTQIRTLIKITPDIPMRIRGKYCLAHIEMDTDVPELKLPLHLAHGRGLWNGHLGNPNHFVGRYTVANWGVCIPNGCSGEVVQEMLQNSLKAYNITTGIEFHVEASDDDCYARKSKRFFKILKSDNKVAGTALSILALSGLVLAAVIHEFKEIFKELFHKILGLLKKKSDKASETNASVEQEGDANAGETKNDEAAEGNTAEAAASESQQESEEAKDGQDTEAPLSTITIRLRQLLLEVFQTFSPRRTVLQLLSQDRFNADFPLFHVLKLAATFMLYICLKFLMIGHLPITNREKLVRAFDQPFSVLFRAPVIYTDILLVISGFLVAYQLSEEMEQKKFIHLLKRLASKMARYLPTLLVVLSFQTWILPHLGSGPLWPNLVEENTRLCEQHMWRNAFGVQNAVDFEETCSPLSTQLALEIQLYVLGPLLVWLYYTDVDAAFFTYGALHAMSVAARFSRTNREHLSMIFFHGMNVSKFYRTANLLYASPIARATPYLLGIGAGILYRSQQGFLEVATHLVPVGWLLCALAVFWCFWCPSLGMRTDFVYSSNEAASYAAWNPLIMGLALCWLIFMFPKTDSNILRFLAGSRPLLFLSRITFPMQLVMYVVIFYNTATVKEPMKYQMSDLVNLQEIALIVVLATFLAFIIDVPFQRIRHLIIEHLFIELALHQQHAEKDVAATSEAGDEASEEEQSEAKPTSDTPEPSDAIWSSDPEEEEHKYLARRRSSATTLPKDASEASKKKANAAEDVEAEEEEEEEEEADFGEEEEVKKRPVTPPVAKPVEEAKATVTRRRRPTSDD